MSLAEAKTQKTDPADIHGRMDAIDGARLFGWVWDRAHPDERLQVRVLLGGRMVASGVADRPRIDLRRNGIGDGAHAFEVQLPDFAMQQTEQLSVVAVSPSTGQEVMLRVPSQDERAAEAAVSAPLARVLDQLDVLIAAQRRSQIIQREAAEILRATAEEVEKLSSTEDGIGAALEVVRANQDELSRRVSDVEVFLMRFDRTLADFDERIRDLAAAADRPMRRAVTLLAALGAISAVAAIAAVALLLVRKGGL
ncbi:hypothetical protein QNA08_17350 [Chelatococcus sp. SYSU_G07232]|uniref:Membrane-anchored protein n=1 Tax=Chelatococcus albus TaxID=3047466 RepID=A0ABT7AM09_9HYPH|nr:hypothetical protein [Chelatococcus sp. SYSU_G07232]MDJ1159982.1 hypothetical protein [Chelatococcus sp. SYSU_G07232]